MVHHNVTSLVWTVFDDVKHFNEAFGHSNSISILYSFDSNQCLNALIHGIPQGPLLGPFIFLIYLQPYLSQFLLTLVMLPV